MGNATAIQYLLDEASKYVREDFPLPAAMRIVEIAFILDDEPDSIREKVSVFAEKVSTDAYTATNVYYVSALTNATPLSVYGEVSRTLANPISEKLASESLVNSVLAVESIKRDKRF
jgi:hypothetical protein